MLLIFVRVSAFFVTVPLFSYRTIPPQLKIVLAFLLAWMMYYYDSNGGDSNRWKLLFTRFERSDHWAMIGLAAYIIISAVQIAGGFIDFEMGFAMANIIDPQTGAQSPMMGQFFNILILFVLLVHQWSSLNFGWYLL